MKVIGIRIGLLRPDDENSYWAEAIEDGDKYYYRVNDTILKISEDQFCNVVNNPFLYDFSTALQLHERIERVKRGVPEGAPNC